MNLSIVIPSYNRNTTLLANLPRLLRQLRQGVELRILDNCSRIPISETLAPLLAQYPQADVEIQRNMSNIGGDANILRSFEVTHSDWLWILGDDDVIVDDAVDRILRAIETHPDAAYFNFSTSTMRSQGLRPHDFDTVGQADFVRKLDLPGNVNFMSVGLWHVPSAMPGLFKAYKYAYSMSPTFTLLLTTLGEHARCHFSAEVLVDTITTAEASTKWHFSDFILGWNTILELPMPTDTRRMLARKMYSWHAPENVCVYLLAEALHKPEDAHRFTLASNRLSPYIGIFARLRYRLYKPLFWSPRLTWPLVTAVVRLAVRLKIKGVDLNDIVERAQHRTG